MRNQVFSVLLKAVFFPATMICFNTDSITAQPVISFSNFITSGLTSPVDITNAGDGTNRLFIVQQNGIIRIHNGASLLPTPFLNVSTIISGGGERGLLSLAFHPDYENPLNRYFFIYYTNLSGDITIARYQAQAGDPNQADAASGVVLMNIPKPFANHNGGDLNFGPDGYLYFGTGDGGSGGDPNNLSQNGNSLLGKMIRINVNSFFTPPYYTIPPDNPYLSDPLVDDHIWAIGLRNPWRWSFDRLTNDMWIADVGQASLEEINFRAAGTSGGINYGWRCYEGNNPYNTTGCAPPANYVFPIFNYPHNGATGGFSVTGGFVYRGAEFPSLQGYYICADYVSANIWLITPNGSGGWTSTRQSGLPGSISGFGEAEDGTLYAVSLNGPVYKVVPNAVLPVTLISFSGKKQTGYNEIKWTTASEQMVEKFIIEFSADGRMFRQAGEVQAGFSNGGNYVFNHPVNNSQSLFYRLQTIERTGSSDYSPVIVIGGTKEKKAKVFPAVITNGLISISTERPVKQMALYNMEGKLLFAKQLNGRTGYFTEQLPVLTAGIYYLQMSSDGWRQTEKIIVQ